MEYVHTYLYTLLSFLKLLFNKKLLCNKNNNEKIIEKIIFTLFVVKKIAHIIMYNFICNYI